MDDGVTLARLAKLLRLLTSNHDGEVLAAAHKINGIVAAHDLDWDKLLGGPKIDLTQQQMTEIYQAGYQRGLADGARSSGDDWADAGRARTDEVGSRLHEVEEIVAAGLRAVADRKLSRFERSFVESMAERLDEWGSRTFVSEKQWRVLQRLKAKLS